MAERLSEALVAQLKAKAGDAGERSDSSDLHANAKSGDDMLAGMPKSDDPAVREYLEGMNAPFAGMIANLATGDGSQAKGLMGMLGAMTGGHGALTMVGGDMMSVGGSREQAAAPPPAGEQAVAAAEAELGFALPGDLRQFYLDVADGGVGPGDGLFSLAELVAKWREMTDEPCGPRGQAWPGNLLPVAGQCWDLSCIDRETGKLTAFDPEEIDHGGWAKAFKPKADSLEAWLAEWAGGATAHEAYEDEMTAAKARWAEEEIAKLEARSEATRASHGYVGDDWRNEVRRRFGAPLK